MQGTSANLLSVISELEKGNLRPCSSVPAPKQGFDPQQKIKSFAYGVFQTFIKNANSGQFKKFYDKATHKLMRSVYPIKSKNREKQQKRQKETPVKCMQCFIQFLQAYRKSHVPQELCGLSAVKDYFDVVQGRLNGNSFNNNLMVTFQEFLSKSKSEITVKMRKQQKQQKSLKLFKAVSKAISDSINTGTESEIQGIKKHLALQVVELEKHPSLLDENRIFSLAPSQSEPFQMRIKEHMVKQIEQKFLLQSVIKYGRKKSISSELITMWVSKGVIAGYGAVLRQSLDSDLWEGGSLSDYSNHLRAQFYIAREVHQPAEFYILLEKLPAPVKGLFWFLHNTGLSKTGYFSTEEFMELITKNAYFNISSIKLVQLDELVKNSEFSVLVPTLLCLKNFFEMSVDERRSGGASAGM